MSPLPGSSTKLPSLLSGCAMSFSFRDCVKRPHRASPAVKVGPIGDSAKETDASAAIAMAAKINLVQRTFYFIDENRRGLET